MQSLIHDELEARAAELDDTNGELPPNDDATLEDAALRLAPIPEALEAVRDARRQLVRGRASGQGQGPEGKGKSRGRAPARTAGGGGGRALASKIRNKKGHWAGDPERPAGNGRDALAADVVDDEDDCEEDVSEAMVVMCPPPPAPPGAASRAPVAASWTPPA